MHFTGAERFLGSSAAADSGCRLISQARLTVDLGALLIGSSIVKELSSSRSESGSPSATPAKCVDAFDCATRLAERKTVRDWSKD